MHALPLAASLGLSLAFATAQEAFVGGVPPPVPLQLPDVVPIHSGPDHADGSGPYGQWAAGSMWKASFHGGMSFYPCLPEAATTVGWQWRTLSVTVGGQALDLQAPRMTTTERRCVYDHGTVAEAYDVLAEGLEQTFRITELPGSRGELVVTGRVTTGFSAQPRPAALAPIEFLDGNGIAVVRYGVATAIDADGRRCDVPTSFDGELLRLHVPAAFLRNATLPLLIDPLLAPTLLSANGLGVHGLSVACSTQAGQRSVFVTVIRSASSTDRDAYAFRFPDDFSSPPVQTFLDVSTASDVLRMDVAEVGDNRFGLALSRNTPIGRTTVVLLQSSTTTTVNSGTMLGLPLGHYDADIGGSRGASAQRALVVTTVDVSPSSRRVYGHLIDGTVLGAPFSLHSFASSADSHSPAVTDSGGSEGWCVAWASAYGAATDDIRTARVSSSGVPGTTRVAASSVSPSVVRIGGGNDRYLATWVVAPGDVRAVRYDLPPGANVTVLSTSWLPFPPATAGFQYNGNVAHDFVTQSHWATATSVLAFGPLSSATLSRHGTSGAILDSDSVTSPGGIGSYMPSAVAFRGRVIKPNQQVDSEGFGFVYCRKRDGYNIWDVFYSNYQNPAAATASYGVSCSNDPPTTMLPPYAGSADYVVQGVTGTPLSPLAIALFGASPTDLDLTGSGMPGCRLLVNYFVALPGTPMTSLSQVTIDLPDAPVFLGSLFAQWAWLAPGANPAQMQTGRAAELIVR